MPHSTARVSSSAPTGMEIAARTAGQQEHTALGEALRQPPGAHNHAHTPQCLQEACIISVPLGRSGWNRRTAKLAK